MRHLASLLDPNEMVKAESIGLGQYRLLVMRGDKVVMNHALEQDEFKELLEKGLLELKPIS